MKIKELLLTIITLGLNLLLSWLKEYNSMENKIGRLHGKYDKKLSKAKKNIKKDRIDKNGAN